jgi:hypothetical protein
MHAVYTYLNAPSPTLLHPLSPNLLRNPPHRRDKFWITVSCKERNIPFMNYLQIFFTNIDFYITDKRTFRIYT